jgi:hypothetical protein
VGPAPDPLLLKKNLVALGIEPRTFGSVARNSDHQTTELVIRFPAVPIICVIYIPIFLWSVYRDIRTFLFTTVTPEYTQGSLNRYHHSYQILFSNYKWWILELQHTFHVIHVKQTYVRAGLCTTWL